MKLCSSRGLPVLAASAVVALALLISPPAMAEDANPAATEGTPAADVLDVEAPVVPTAEPAAPPVSDESVSVLPPDPIVTTTATSPLATSVDESDGAAPDTSNASETQQASPEDEPAGGSTSGVANEASAEVDPVPPVRFFPYIASRHFLVGETAAVNVDFECYSNTDVPVARCYLLDHLGVERLRGDKMNLPAGTYQWVGTAETASGEKYRTIFTLSVEERDVTAPVLNLDRPEGVTPWSNVPSGRMTAEDPESGIDYVLVSRNDANWVSIRASDYDYSLADGVSTIRFGAVNKHGLETRSGLITLRIDTVSPSVSVGSFGVVSPEGRIEVEYGSSIALDYECDDERSGVASCSSTLPSNGLLDTSAAGEHVVTVTAVDEAGNRTERVVRYFVEGGPTPQDGSGGPAPQDGSGSPVVTDQGGQRPAVTGVVRRSVVGAAGADSLAATGADAWQIAIGSAVAVALMGGGALLLLRRRFAD